MLAWTHYATDTATLDCRARLNDPFFNEHVKYDSEYYISIAVAGYNDPEAQAYYPNSAQGNSGIPVCRQGSDAWVSLNYAFMPGYPMAMDAVMAVEGVLPGTSGQTQNGQAALAGIIVSALGGLLAMLALCRLMAVLARRRKSPDSDDSASTGRWGGVSGLRAAFYLLIFPTGFYLAQVYTEGLFIGLAFMACAMAVERKMLFAAGLAVLATLVRPTGICLIFPLAWAAFEVLREPEARAHWRHTAARVAAPLAPVVPFVVWWFSVLGQNWRAVEDGFFGRKFDPIASLGMWGNVIDSFVSGFDKTATGLYGYGIYTGTPPGPLPSSSTVYIGLELIALALAVAACVWLIRRMPGVALFGFAVIVMSAGSSSAQGMDRYMIAVPAIFLMLASFGRRPVFDRVWVLGSTLVMGLLVTLYTFGFWVS